jgi:nitrogen fixation/metabolism regulation signal transduction histidine kinase
MAIKQEVHVTIGVLILFQLTLAFGAIGLLERMSSKIQVQSTEMELTLEQTKDQYIELIKTNKEAKRLGTAGAWTLVLMGFTSFILTLALAFRLNRNVVNPIEEIQSALKDWRSGNRFRRCTTSLSPPELAASMTTINQLFDEQCSPSLSKSRSLEKTDEWTRETILFLLEKSESPVLIIDHEGQIKAANNLALSILSRSKSAKTREQLAKVPKNEIGSDIKSASQIGQHLLWYCVLKNSEG